MVKPGYDTVHQHEARKSERDRENAGNDMVSSACGERNRADISVKDGVAGFESPLFQSRAKN